LLTSTDHWNKGMDISEWHGICYFGNEQMAWEFSRVRVCQWRKPRSFCNQALDISNPVLFQEESIIADQSENVNVWLHLWLQRYIVPRWTLLQTGHGMDIVWSTARLSLQGVGVDSCTRTGLPTQQCSV